MKYCSYGHLSKLKKKSVESRKMQNSVTQNWGTTVYWSKHTHAHTYSMSEPTEVTGQLQHCFCCLTPKKRDTPPPPPNCLSKLQYKNPHHSTTSLQTYICCYTFSVDILSLSLSLSLSVVLTTLGTDILLYHHPP